MSRAFQASRPTWRMAPCRAAFTSQHLGPSEEESLEQANSLMYGCLFDWFLYDVWEKTSNSATFWLFWWMTLDFYNMGE